MVFLKIFYLRYVLKVYQLFTSNQSKEPEEKQEKFCEIYFILSFLGLCEIMFFSTLHLELRDVIKQNDTL